MFHALFSHQHEKKFIKCFEALSSSVLCSNKLPRCEVYGRTVCSSYVTWAKVNCPLYCGFCTGNAFVLKSTGNAFVLKTEDASDVF